MRVIFLSPSVRLLGARQSLLALARRLPPGIDPLVVCPSDGALLQELQSSGIPVRVVPHGPWRKAGGRLTAIFRQVPKLRQLAREFRPDVWHANEFHSVPAAVHGCGGGVGKAAVTGHVRLSITPRQIRNYHLAGCARIIAVSRACQRLFDGSGLEERVRVVYNGVDVEGLDAFRAQGRAFRAECGWTGDELVVCLLGLVSPRKNQIVLVDAAAEANRRGIPVRILLAGDPFKGTLQYGEALRQRLNNPEIRSIVRWEPFRDDPGVLYAASDLNALVSSEEGFGRTIIEAAALGIPSVGTAVGGIPELVDDGKTGWIVPPRDVGALADALAQAANPAERHRRGDAARRRADEAFTIAAHARAMVAVWDEAIEATRRR